VGTLDGASGREGPARAALSLVLDGGNGTLGAPVNSSGIDLGEGDLIAGAGGVHGAKVGGGELSQGQIGELVDTEGEGVDTLGSLSIVLADDIKVGLESGKAGSLLHTVGVGLAKSSLELSELSLGAQSRRASDDSENCDDDLHFKTQPINDL